MECPVIVFVKRYRVIVINYAQIRGIIEKSISPFCCTVKRNMILPTKESGSKKWRILVEIFI